jgi:hypothetical protein
MPSGTRRYVRLAVVVGFFGVLLAIGLAVHRDYGVSWDEPVQRRLGQLSWDYARNHDQQLLENRNRYYGPVYEMFLAEMERLSHLREIRDIYNLRHLSNFLLFFVAVFFFYLLCRRRFRDWRVAVLGCSLLCLSPRIFADAFYNSKDLPFLCLFVVAFYTMLRLLDKPTWARAIAHAVVSAWLVDIRVLGIVVPLLTLLGAGLQWLRVDPPGQRKIFTRHALYLAGMTGLIVLFWPTLWRDPVGQFRAAMSLMARYHWAGPVLYRGELVPTSQIPWHYTLVWIGITTPVTYILGFLVGMPVVLKRVWQSPRRYSDDQTFDLLVVLWVLLPLGAVILLKSVVYDAWRHVFFIYPGMLLVALHGFEALYHMGPRVLGRIRPGLVRAVLIGCLALNAAGALVFMVRYHPHQNVFFNQLVGGLRGAQYRFEMDYWGLSYRQGLEYIAGTDPAPRISVYVAEQAGKFNIEMLRQEDRVRFVLAQRREDADYFLGSYRLATKPYPYSPEYYGVKVGGVSILSVFKMPASQDKEGAG